MRHKDNIQSKIRPMFQAAVQSTTLELYIYDSIGSDWYGGVSAQDVADAIKAAGTFSDILVRINSPGGSVFEGSTIYNLLQSQGKPITVYVDGLAASAAFTIAMVGHNIRIGQNAMMMLHNGWSLAIGDGNEMRKQADLLDKINLVMQGVYARRSGQELAEIKTMMDAETWLTPEEAVEKGFANEVMGTSEEDAAQARALATQLLARSKATHYAHVPDKFKAEDVETIDPHPETDCPCPCPDCVAGDCGDCTNADCDFDECDHAEDDPDEDADMRARASQRNRALQLAERAVQLDV